MLGSDVDGGGPSHLAHGNKSPELSNMTKGTKPTVAGSTVVGQVVNPPVQSVGNQMLTGHAAEKGQKKFSVLTYYGREQP
jgi:hypothetical protein